MKIRVSYNYDSLEFLKFIEAPNIELARKRFRFASVINTNRIMLKFCLVFEYEELIEASKLTSRVRNSYNKRMLLFMKYCPSFEIVSRPYRITSFDFKELYQVKYIGNEVLVNVSLSYDVKYPSVVVFKIRPKCQ